jgi:hypothetical protein
MADIAIRRTTVTPDNDGSVVQLHISDMPPEAESAKTVIQLSLHLPAYRPPLLLTHIQRETMIAAQETLSALLQALADEIGETRQIELRPKIKSQHRQMKD